MWDSPGGCCHFNIPSRTGRTVASDTVHHLWWQKPSPKGKWGNLSPAVEKQPGTSPTCPCGFPVFSCSFWTFLCTWLQGWDWQRWPCRVSWVGIHLPPTLSSPGWILSQEKLIKEMLDFLIKKLVWFLELHLYL